MKDNSKAKRASERSKGVTVAEEAIFRQALYYPFHISWSMFFFLGRSAHPYCLFCKPVERAQGTSLDTISAFEYLEKGKTGGMARDKEFIIGCS